MQKIEKYILEDIQEIQTIKNCLNYCLHRAREHGKASAGNIKEIEKLRAQFGITKKN